MSKRLAIVEDDPEMGAALIGLLRPYGFECLHFLSAEDFLMSAEDMSSWSLLLVDWLLPGMSGVALISKIAKSEAPPPIILVSSIATDDDVAHGLHVGADDYVIKPFNKSVLLARVHAVLRRQTVQSRGDKESFQKLRFNDETLAIETWQGKRCVLSLHQFRLLKCLLESEDQVIARDALMDAVWVNEHPSSDSRALDLLVSRLRHKLTVLLKLDVDIRNAYGRGYFIKIR